MALCSNFPLNPHFPNSTCPNPHRAHKALPDLVPLNFWPHLLSFLLLQTGCLFLGAFALVLVARHACAQLSPWLTPHSLQVLFKHHYSVRPPLGNISRIVPTQQLVSLIPISHTAYFTDFSCLFVVLPHDGKEIFPLCWLHISSIQNCDWHLVSTQLIFGEWVNVSGWTWRVGWQRAKAWYFCLRTGACGY